MATRALAAGTADTESIRTETFRGREYTVVPVVGLVEGVIQGLNAENPEFAPAEEFAKFPAGWNGRPVTMNHPRDSNGNLVSANAPIILEEYQIGFLANSFRDSTKLKFEAWIDNELVAEMAGEPAETLDRLNSGETIVEVSTGLFTEVMPYKGIYNGQSYNGTWASVVPDHLALLSEGSIGACSVADGCGAPRLNNRLKVHTKGAQEGAVTTVQTLAPLNLGAPPKECCDACAQGDPCMARANSQGADQSGQSQPSEENDNAEGTNGRREGGNPEGGQPADDSGGDAVEGSGTPEQANQLPEQVAAELLSNQRAAHAFNRLVTNAIDPNITLENARTVLKDALQDKLPYTYVCVLAMTVDQVVYMIIDWESEQDGETYAINYAVDANGGVTLTGEPAPVNLLTRIVPKVADEDDNGGISGNEGTSGANQQQEGTADMAGGNQTAPVEGQEGQQQAPAQGSENAGEDVSTNANGAEAPSAPRTLEESLDSMHPDVREVVQEGIELRTQKRAKLISAIVANSNGVYTEEDLKTRDMQDLVKLNTLCAPRSDYSGRSFPDGRNAPGINSNASDEITEVPPAPKAFEKKPARRGTTVNSRPGDDD